MEFKGTSGKWSIYQRIDDNEENQYSVTSNNGKVCYCYNMSISDYENNIAKANALLISKAPEILEMIEELIYQFESNNNSSQETDLLNEAKQLIKEATEL